MQPRIWVDLVLSRVHSEAFHTDVAFHSEDDLERVHTKEAAEALLRELPSVLGAFVREDINGHPREIHLLVSPGPNVKLLAQDVRDLLEEKLEVPIDHRVISIAQLAQDLADDDAEATIASVTDPRRERRVQLLDVRAEVREQRVRVQARLQSGEKIFVGEAHEIDLGVGRLRAAATATLRAAAEASVEDVRLELEAVAIVKAFDREYVLVSVLAGSNSFGRKLLQLAGAQPVEHDTETAAALATLKSINRVLAKLLP
jgi:hypothetical protein